MRFRLAVVLTLVSALLSACGPGTRPSIPSPTAAAAADAAPTASAKPSVAATGASPAVPVASISGPFEGEARSLNGAGSTFAAVLYSKWSDAYDKLTHVQVNYQSIGSGGGIKSIQDQTVDYGASDGPMTDQQLAAAKGGAILHIPTALGAVVPTYNVPGVTEPLKFTPETLAGIFLGTIPRWNDARLVADNPQLANVNADIVVVHRSDGSGTTYTWVDYLSTVSPEWAQNVGRGTSVNWPVGLGGKGNEGVAGEVKQDANSIGYVELIYALQNKLGVGLVKNKSGRFVEPRLEGVTAAAASSAATAAPDLRVSIVDAPGDSAYPISTYTWVLAYKNMADRAKAIALTRFLWWGTHEGQAFTQDLGYAPIPAEITARSELMIRQISADGQPAFPGR